VSHLHLVSDRERDFDTALREERDRLAAVDRRPDLFASLAFRSHEPIRDPAVGGKGGLVFMLVVAFLIGAMLAIGGAL
jgi:hypothetical protein